MTHDEIELYINRSKFFGFRYFYELKILFCSSCGQSFMVQRNDHNFRNLHKKLWKKQSTAKFHKGCK